MSSEDLLKIFGALAPVLITALIGYWQYLNKKTSDQYSENIKELYSAEQEKVLSSVANMITFKKKERLRKITQDTLINRIYTELDYNICNAISNQLVTMVDKNHPDELNYIIKRLVDINYNYFMQDYGIKGRVNDLEKQLNQAENDYANQKKNENDEREVMGLLEDLKERVKNKWQEYTDLKDLKEYKIKWHKQIIGDSLGMILSRASKLSFNNIIAEFIANDFNYCTFRNIKIHHCSMRKSAFSVCIFQQAQFSDLKLDDNFLSDTVYENCYFKDGSIKRTTFHYSAFYNATFENINFDSVCFYKCQFDDCCFINVTGIEPAMFFGSGFKSNLPDFEPAVRKIDSSAFKEWLASSKFTTSKYGEILKDYQADEEAGKENNKKT